MTGMGKREKVEATAEEVERHPAAAAAASVGQAVNGVVHIVIGLLAIGVARGAGGSADQSGAMRAIESTPLGSIGLWLAGLALYALALYSFAVAIGELRRKLTQAARHAGKGIAYATVGTVAINYALGGSADGEETTKSLTAELLATTWGAWLLAITGVVIIAVGIGLAVSGIRQTFLKDVDVTGKTRRTFAMLGTTGYLAKGVAIGVVGVLFILAVLNRNPDEAGGLDSALKKLTELPYGAAVLIVVGAGLITYGIYCFAAARAIARKRR